MSCIRVYIFPIDKELTTPWELHLIWSSAVSLPCTLRCSESSHFHSLVPSEHAIYSPTTLHIAIRPCFWDFHKTAVWLQKMTRPPWDWWSALLLAQSESACTVSWLLLPMLLLIHNWRWKVEVNLTFWKTLLGVVRLLVNEQEFYWQSAVSANKDSGTIASGIYINEPAIAWLPLISFGSISPDPWSDLEVDKDPL